MALYKIEKDASGVPTGETSLVAGGTLYSDLPIAAQVLFSGSDIPSGFLECDGSTFSSTDYPDLYSALGSTTLPNNSGYIIKAKSVALPSDFISAVDEAVERVAESKDSGVATLDTGVKGIIRWYRRGHAVSVDLESVSVTGTERVTTIATGLPKALHATYGSINHNIGLAESYPIAVSSDGSLTVHATIGETPTLVSTYGGISYLSDDY